MSVIAITARQNGGKRPMALEQEDAYDRELLGVRARPAERVQGSIGVNRRSNDLPVGVDTPVADAAKPAPPSELEKAVRRMPTLYVIAFFGVLVGCAVLIIWNTLQVNRLTLERTRLEDRITQAEQRIIKLRAEEMQLTAPSRIREIATQKLGMVEGTGEELVIIH